MSDVGNKKTCLDSDHGHNIGSIQEILNNFFVRLPVEDLLRCKSVSKLWYWLTSEPKFTRSHFSHSLENTKLIACLYNDNHDSELYQIDRNNRETPLLGLPEFVYSSSFEMISSFNGLIVGTYLGTNDELDIKIINPATREFQVLPVGTTSAVTPSVGVVFDPENYRYKILRFYRDTLQGQNRNHKCEIYTPDSGAWRGVDDVMQCPVGNPAFPLCASNVSVGGRMYWLVWSKDDRTIPDHILSVDMEDNFTKIDLPDEEIFNLFTFLVENEGRLILIGMDDTETNLLIWSYDLNESTWVHKGGAELESDTNFDVISYITSIKNELLFVIKNFHTENYRYLVFDLDSMTWQEDLQVPRKFKTCDAVIALPFAESLFRCDMTN